METMERRKPTLADGFLNYKVVNHKRGIETLIDPKTVAQIQAKVRVAHKYVFDETAASRVGQVVGQIPSLVVREYKFARAPYDLTWIEYPHYAYWPELHKHPNFGADVMKQQDGKSDFMVGYLIDHNTVYTVSGGTLSNKNVFDCALWPMVYELNTEWPFKEQLDMAMRLSVSRLGLDEYFWGSSSNMLSFDEMRVLRDHNAMYLLKTNPRAGVKHIEEILHAARGDLRTVVAILLMLNRPSVTQYKQTLPNYRSFHKGKMFPFVKHVQVTVNLDPMPEMKLIGTPQGDSVPRRFHEVEGHYCHNQEARDYARIAGCIHDWQDTDEDWLPIASDSQTVHHWLCKVCHGKRWWTKEHWRGNPTVGTVIKDQYNVTE